MEQVYVSVGMGPGQHDFIKHLKERGFTVAAFGKGKNSEEAMRMCDYCAEIDTRDYEAAAKWLDSLNINVIAVGSYSGGQAVRTVTKLSNYFHTATCIPDEIISDNTKIGQQRMLEKHGLSSIKTFGLREFENVGELNLTDKYVVKPDVGRGSEGVKIVSYAELSDIYRGSLEDDKTVVQSFRKGTEYRCVLMINEGKIILLAPVKRTSYKNTVFLGVLEYSDKDYNNIYTFFESFVKRAGIVNSVIKTDVIVSADCIDVIEMDIGAGGGMYYKKYVGSLFGINLMDEYINLTLGKKLDEFKVTNPCLRMEYVFNNFSYPVGYDIEECMKALSDRFGEAEIVRNILEPEKKGGYASNADFIFTVIRSKKQDNAPETFEVDDFVNSYLLHKV